MSVAFGALRDVVEWLGFDDETEKYLYALVTEKRRIFERERR